LQSKISDGKSVPIKEDAPVDLVADLLMLNVGQIYKELSKDSKFGYLPLMAQASKGQIGTLNAESFCERGLLAGNLIMTDGNTFLSNDEAEYLAVLRMNEDFMDYMRSRSPKSSK